MNYNLVKAIECGNVRKFYTSSEWIKKREEILKRDNNECQRCKSEGRFNIGEVVHHEVHLKDNPLLALTDSNLTTLCYTCHNIVHPEKLNNERKERFINEERWE